jgi:glycine cleavage system H protein
LINFLENQWIQIDQDTLTIGVTEEGLDHTGRAHQLMLPAIDDLIDSKKSFGELVGSRGSMSLYTPYEGVVTEINEAMLDSPDLLHDDPLGDSWLIRLKVDNSKEDPSEEQIRIIEELIQNDQ